MNKKYCDFCQDEITDLRSPNRLDTTTAMPQPNRLPVTIFIKIEFTTNKEHTRCEQDICRNCMWQLIDMIDPREPEDVG